jgi:hypothetical protein
VLTNHLAIRFTSVLLCLASVVFSVQAIDRRTTPTGIHFVSGCIGNSELLLLNEDKPYCQIVLCFDTPDTVCNNDDPSFKFSPYSTN